MQTGIVQERVILLMNCLPCMVEQISRGTVEWSRVPLDSIYNGNIRESHIYHAWS